MKLLLLTLMLSASAAAADVEQWGTYEVALPGPETGNPFIDVTVSARFSHGDRTVAARGFYDGGGTYRIRFMPDEPGAWHYVTSSSAAALDGKAGDFVASAPSAGNHGPVRVAHTYHFAYADGTPYRELGTTCYAWEWQPEALQEQTLKTLAGAPFNKIRFCVFPKHYAWNENEPMLYPFPPGTGGARWDLARFNPAYFQHLEQRVRDLQRLGIEADIILFHPYDQGHWGFDRMPAAADDRYLHYVVARLAAYRNVWWSLANEWDFMKEKRESDFVRFGEIVARDDPSGHLLSIHNGAKMFNHTLPWITHASVQNGFAVEDAGRAELYREIYRKPIVFDEVKYEGDIDQRWGRLSGREMVRRFWNATVAGTYCGHGETFRSDDQILWWSKGGVLKGQSPARLAFLKRILADAPAEGIDPVDHWEHDPVIGGQSGKYYLIYFGNAAPTEWKVELPRMAAGIRVRVEVVDTWNMTVRPVPEVFTLVKRSNYRWADEAGRSVALPGRPDQLLRIRAL